MDLVLMEANGISDYHSFYSAYGVSIDTTPAASTVNLVYDQYYAINGNRTNIARACRLRDAYHVLFHQMYLHPIVADAHPIFDFLHPFQVQWLFNSSYRFCTKGTLYTIKLNHPIGVGGDLSCSSLLTRLVTIFDNMTHRYYRSSRIVHCGNHSISIFLESTGVDASIYYDILYQYIEICLQEFLQPEDIPHTITSRIEYR
jgi:hypothetical protein